MATEMKASMFSMLSMFNMHMHACMCMHMHACMCMHVCACMHGTSPHIPIPTPSPSTHLPPP